MLLSSSQIFTSSKRKMSPRIWHWILSLHPSFFLGFPLAPFSLICRILNLLKWAELLYYSEVIRCCFFRQARVKEKIRNNIQAGTEGFLIHAWDKLSENFLHHVFIHTHFTTLSLSGFCTYTERSVDLSLRAMIDRVESFEVLTVWSCKPQI